MRDRPRNSSPQTDPAMRARNGGDLSPEESDGGRRSGRRVFHVYGQITPSSWHRHISLLSFSSWHRHIYLSLA
jgi:hypothetical protein